jgi:hypothetical protein
MDRLAEIKRLYYKATTATIQKDLARAVGLLKELDEGDRERAAVFMDGLSQMRSEWGLRKRPPRGRGGRVRR